MVDGEEALSERSFRNAWARSCRKARSNACVLRHAVLTQPDIRILQGVASHSRNTMNACVHREVGNVEKISRNDAGLFTGA